jgi:acyl carrier protein
MKNEEIKNKVRGFFGKYIQKKDWHDEEEILTTGIVSSLFAMQLIMFVEKEFQIKVENEDLDLKNFNSIGTIAKFVDNKLSVVLKES